MEFDTEVQVLLVDVDMTLWQAAVKCVRVLGCCMQTNINVKPISSHVVVKVIIKLRLLC